MSSGFTVATNEHLIRSNLWTKQIKELLMDDLQAMRFVKVLTDFPDGTTFNIPSIGEAETSDFAEGQAIRYNKLDTGNFTFEFDQYKYSAHSISEKFKRDSFYAEEVISAFVPRQHRALMEAVETRILSRGPTTQTAANLNTINSAPHRWVGNGTNETMAIRDFALARYSLTKANVPLNNLVAFVDPSVTYAIMNQTNVMNLLTPDPMWQSVVREGGTTGTHFKFNLFGFDVYESNYLHVNTASETIDSVTAAAGVCNLFFSAAPGDTLPIVGGFRQQPQVYSEFNKDLQQEEFLTIAEYGFKLYRPENMIVVITDTDQVT
jgi:hypothetical protein